MLLTGQYLKKVIIDDSTTKCEYTEIRENNVNVSQQLNYNFIWKDSESLVLTSDSYFYAKLKITQWEGSNM